MGQPQAGLSKADDMGPIARRAEAGLRPLEALMLLGKVTAAGLSLRGHWAEEVTRAVRP